jgi:dTDP-L-rhamnose 4-epimerase
MTTLNILITGGAGFIGSHIADHLLAVGHRVRVFDNLTPQVHGPIDAPPTYLSPHVEFIRGDVRDPDALDRALAGIDVVYHKAARVGVGQSMYEIRDYTDTNTMGTAVLLELLAAKHRDHIQRLIVASSMSIYGEGRYIDPATGQPVLPRPRSHAQLAAGRWEMLVPGTELGTEADPEPRAARPAPTIESKPLEPASIYAINKRDQEEMCLVAGHSYGIPTTALRYFNVYGPRQALSNPYTGVAAIFCGCYLNANRPMIFEDGGQSRDFIHVEDIARANLLALNHPESAGHAINIGTGRATSINRVAQLLLENLFPDRAADPGLLPEIKNKFRQGDIRHCYGDITLARKLLGFEPTIAYEDGIRDLIAWVRTQTAVDRTADMLQELTTRKLV